MKKPFKVYVDPTEKEFPICINGQEWYTDNTHYFTLSEAKALAQDLAKAIEKYQKAK